HGIINGIVELTLAGNMPVNDMQRLEWTTIDKESSKMDKPKMMSVNDLNIVLNPMQIRTFRVTVE
ncbi:unnamed protein product, partial [Adineta steineri]